MAKEMPRVARGSLCDARERLRSATDDLSGLLVGVPENECAVRMEFIYRDLAKAQSDVVEALRYWAERDHDRE